MASLLHLSHSDRYEVLLQCVLICIPMMTNEVATLFIGRLAILLQSACGGFCTFSNVCLFKISVSALCIFWVWVPCKIQVLQISSV